jgi:hypothetical protein
MAGEIHAIVEQHNHDKERSLYKLFNFLITNDFAYGITESDFFENDEIKKTFYTRLRYLVQVNKNKNNQEINESQINLLCEMNKPFIRFKNIEIKRLFISKCQELYQQLDFAVPAEISRIEGVINQAISKIQSSDREQLIKSTDQIIARVLQGIGD